jgi:oxygen-independent coproporphyrinogen-3 oxidase
MAGLYIHVPFCNRKCLYCDFFSGNQLYLIDSYVDALILEIELRHDYIEGSNLKTIYFGGGTPSLLTNNHLDKIFQTIFSVFKIDTEVEITIECNPEDINSDYVRNLYELGINRISLGIQFLDDLILKKFRRNHSKELIFNALEIINQSKFLNLSIDLIYSVPDISDEYLLYTLQQLLKFDIKHISAYSLTIARNSQYYWKIKNGEFVENNEDNFLDQYKIVNDFLKKNEYIQYELSNYAKDGYFSLHNLGYWNQVPYLGVGVTAHSYNIFSRQWNQANIKKYIRDLNVGKSNFGFVKEDLSEVQQYNEYIILKLRTYQGLSVKYIERTFNAEIFQYFLSNINALIDKGYFIRGLDKVIPKETDLLIGDYLSKILMF